jgi:hypothetical protein
MMAGKLRLGPPNQTDPLPVANPGDTYRPGHRAWQKRVNCSVGCNCQHLRSEAARSLLSAVA